MYIWEAQAIDNLSDYLKFWRDRVSLVFVTKSIYKDDLGRRLNSSGASFSLRYAILPSLDPRSVEVQELTEEEEIKELNEHDGKLRSFMEAELDHLKRLEALIFFYTPVYRTNEQTRRKMCTVMGIEESRLSHLTDNLVQSKVAAVTGNIIWLRQPGVAKKLLDDFITRGVFPVESLV